MRTELIWFCLAACFFSTGVQAGCDGFADVDDSATYCTAVAYVQERGVTIGCTDSTHYCPNDYVTRAQMALFLQRMGQADSSNHLGDHTTAIGGGTGNTVFSYNQYNTVAGGESNTATGGYSTVGGGQANFASDPNFCCQTVGGGSNNTASDGSSTVGGGDGNSATGGGSTVGGGFQNQATGYGSTVLGGANNQATGQYSLAAGYYAEANADDCAAFSFWDQGMNVGMSCLGQAGSVRFAPDHGLSIDYGIEKSNGAGSRYVYFGNFATGVTIGTWTGAVLTDAGVWTNVSDRNVKHNFAPIDSEDVLARVVAMPVTRWEYKIENGVTHIGPVAQDFFAAFDVGADDRHITTIDESGVALAAIQGLNAKLESTVAEQANELAGVKALLAGMKQQLTALTSQRRVVDLPSP